MNKTKKLAISVSAVIVVLLIIFLAIRFFNDNSYRNQIPGLPDFATMPAPVKEQLSIAHNKATNHPSTDNIGRLGLAFHSSAYYDQAKQCYSLAIKQDKSKWIWSYYLGYLEQEMGDSKLAIDNFNAVIKENPKITQVWFYLGKAYQNLGSGELAEAAFKKIANLKPDNSNVRTERVNFSTFPISAKFELARIYMNTKRLDEAEKILTEVVKGNHTIGPVYRLLGNVYSAKGDSVLSKKYIVRAQDLAEVTTLNDTLTDRITLISRSELYLPKQIDDALKSANPEWGLKLFRQAMMYFPDNKFLISKAVKFFLRMNNGKNALPYLDKNLNDFKDNFKEMKDVGDLLYLKGFYTEALPFYSQAKILKPETTEIEENFALSYWKDNQKDVAIKLMNEFYEKNKISPAVLASEVDFMFQISDKEKAKFYLSKFRQLVPSDPKVLKMSGMITDMEGNQKAAIPLYEAALKVDPSDLETAQKLGTFYIEQRNWSKAIGLLRNTIKYHPNESIPLEKLGTLLISCPDPQLQNVEEGLEFSERAFFHISSTITTLISAGKNLALGNLMLGDFKTAAYYMRITLNIAKGEKVPQSYLDGLIRLDSEIKRISNN
ncbi:MAG TPA: tetratricopeptide repeat protein [Prolixibacteraceae bacterium]